MKHEVELRKAQWRETTLDEIAEFRNGKAISPERHSPYGKNPVFGSNGQIARTDDVLNTEPSIAIGRVGAYCGSVYFISEAAWITDNAIVASPKSGNDLRFLSYLLNSLNLRRTAIGSAQPLMTQGGLKVVQTKVPPLNEQQEVAGVLGALDDKIESNHLTSQSLERLARAIFRAWFVDFEPVKAKASGERSFPGMPQDAFDSLPERLIVSELGPIPEGWKVRPLSCVCTLGRGASPRPINDYMDGEVPWVKIADATAANGPFLFKTKEKLKVSGVDKSVKVAPGDLILSNSATCGMPIFVELNGCIHDGWLYFKNLRMITNTYLYHLLVELADHLIQIADGSVQKNLNTKLVGAQNILIPDEIVLAAFNSLACEYFAKIRQNGLESRELTALRDYLLPKLMSGEVRAASPVNIAEEVAKQ